MHIHQSQLFPATAMPDPDWWHAVWPDPSLAVRLIGVGSGMHVIDLCCGDGWFTVPLAQIAARVTAIDLDSTMLRLAACALESAGLHNCDLIEGDAYDVARLVQRQADFIFMANTFHGVPDKERLGLAMAATLKPGGKLAIINWHRRLREETVVCGKPRGPRTDMRMEPEGVAAVFKQSGLTPAGVVELPPYHYAAIFTKPAP